MSEQGLSDTVDALQQQDLAPEARQLLDQAAHLLTEGREEEAHALLSKFQEFTDHQDSGHGSTRTNGNAIPPVQTVIADLSAKLAQALSSALITVIEDLQRYAGDQVESVSRSLADQVAHLDTVLRDVAGIGGRLEQHANEQQAGLAGMQHSQGEIWEAIRTLQQTGREQSESLSRVAVAAEELTHHMSNQVDLVASRFAALEDRVGLIDRLVEEMPGQFSVILTRLDGHTETLRALEQRHTQRVSALNQVLDSLARLKEPEAPGDAMAAFA